MFDLLSFPRGTTDLSGSPGRTASVSLILCGVGVLSAGHRSLVVIALLTPVFMLMICPLDGLANPIMVGELIKEMLVFVPLIVGVAYTFGMFFL